MKQFGRLIIAGLVVALGWTSPLASQIFVSANDGKQVRAGDPIPGPFPDEVVTLSIDGDGRPKVIGRLAIPATLNGPPVSVAVARDGRFALIASAQRFDADGKLQPFGIVSAVDLRTPSQPRRMGQLELPRGAMGVALLPAAKLALVACASDDAVAIVSIRSGRLKLIQTIALEPKSEPRDVVVSPDGRFA